MFKKVMTIALSLCLILSMSTTAYAADYELLDLRDVTSKEELQQINSDIENYLNENASILTLQESAENYVIPLSNGKYIEVETTLGSYLLLQPVGVDILLLT